MKFLSEEAKQTIAKEHGLTVDQINKRIELWSLINDPDTNKPDLVETQRQWIELQKGYWTNRNA